MMKIVSKLKLLIERIAALFPSRLPQGLAHFEQWAESIIKMAGAPNNDSVKFTLAVQVLHLETTISHKAKEFFIRSLRKAMSNQVVSQVINDLKAKQAEANKPTEVTVPTETVTNANPQT